MYNIDEKDKEFAKAFSEFVNGRMCSAKKTGMELANDHRYLVNEKFKVVLAFMEKLAVDYRNGHYDLRDEWACKLASAAIESLELQRLHSCSND
jgi:hypothetical protein